ncbi:Uma2 family endonuclease [Myxacorys almedinensis]|uniref:Uma2 family endonuclease n=1 Tax=Myxacorys almedinensis A TaxID=2690445 RepID=A0A8J7Z2G6_9CYAN|nr:Uma2 family endonuclease [Myxacorys almedinensis]NDJ16928.1 Uma2 family endonuclease [Myxacorys almedinensis A]
MIQTLPQPISFNEFIAWYPENSESRYELHRGAIVEMPKPRGKHSQVAGFISGEAFLEIRRLSLPYFIPKECVVRSVDGESGYKPDVIVLDETAIASEPHWEKSSVIEHGYSIRLIVKVVSTNWRDDYFAKFGEYEALGIPEYWMVDYAALGGRWFIGNPKQPTLSVCELIDGEYEIRQFRGSDRLISPTFPELQLTAEQVFVAGQ